MANNRSFGRRGAAPRRVARAVPATGVPRTIPAAGEILVEHHPTPAEHTDDLSIEQELCEWKRSRGFKVPWRQLSLMASLCFGIASFVLPASVNDPVQWLLYGLTAASLYAGISKRIKNAQN